MNLKQTVLRLAGLLLPLCISGPALAAMYDLPPQGSDVIGQVQHIETKESDTFVALAQQYDVGFRELRIANPDVDPWLPGDGTALTIPTAYILPNVPRKGIVINLPEMRIYYYPPAGSEYAGKVFTYPIGIGREGWSTPIVQTHIMQKIPHPSWTPPASIKKEHAENGDPLPDVVPAGPDNPLGQYALRLGLPSYLIHGTNKPAGIGMRVSHGCIRLFADDIAALFSMASVGTPVNIVNEPYKVGWQGDTLMLEVHPQDPSGGAATLSYTGWVKALIAATREQPKVPVDWDRAEAIVNSSSGVPGEIGSDPQRPVALKEAAIKEAAAK